MAVNVTIFVVVMKEIYKLPRMREKSNRLPHLRATISVFVLLGLNWLFAGLAAIVGTLVFHYLFTITCSFQGLFIFLLHGIIKTDFRDAWRALTSKNRVVEMLRSRSLVTFSKSLSLSSRHSSSVMPLSGQQRSRLAKQQTKIPGKRSVKWTPLGVSTLTRKLVNKLADFSKRALHLSWKYTRNHVKSIFI